MNRLNRLIANLRRCVYEFFFSSSLTSNDDEQTQIWMKSKNRKHFIYSNLIECFTCNIIYNNGTVFASSLFIHNYLIPYTAPLKRKRTKIKRNFHISFILFRSIATENDRWKSVGKIKGKENRIFGSLTTNFKLYICVVVVVVINGECTLVKIGVKFSNFSNISSHKHSQVIAHTKMKLKQKKKQQTNNIKLTIRVKCSKSKVKEFDDDLKKKK